jgi:hypothetical protein
MDIQGELNNLKETQKINDRRIEETLSIIIEHFKEIEERMEALEEKVDSNGT